MINPQILLEEGKCYLCFSSLTNDEIMILASLRRWLLAVSPSENTAPNYLYNYSRCYLCITGDYFQLLKLAFLDLISKSTS